MDWEIDKSFISDVVFEKWFGFPQYKTSEETVVFLERLRHIFHQTPRTAAVIRPEVIRRLERYDFRPVHPALMK